jgi:beta-glucanase (GH16 family)
VTTPHEIADRTHATLTRRALFGAGAGALLTGAGLLLAAPARGALSPDGPHTAIAGTDAPSGKRWRTMWEDRFTGDDLDSATWTAYDGPGQTDLRDQQWNDPSMVSVENGRLILRAQPQPKNGFAYVAGSVSTAGKRVIGPHGRVTTRQFLHPGVGASVGVVLFGENLETVGWPLAGEIDATEVALGRPGAPFGSLHGPGYSGEAPISSTYDGELDSLVGRWVEHTLEWEKGALRWAIDGHVYHEATSADPRAAEGWPFDAPFFVVLTMTVGSYLGGDVDLETWPTDDAGVRTARAEFDVIRFEQLVDC